MDYLQNYLSVLPEYDRSEVEQLIQENTDLFEVKVLSTEEFEALIQQLADTKEKVSELKPTGDKLDAEHFNDLHSNISIDLSRLYSSHLTVEKVIANYDRILRGALDDIQREVDSLATRVEELSLKAAGEDGLVVKTYGFEEANKSANVETNDTEYAHLFMDRDGVTKLPVASLNRSYHQHYLSLPLTTKEDALHNKNGVTTATIDILYQSPNAKGDSLHPLTHAIDASSNTYWTQTVTMKSTASTEISKL